MKYYSGGLSASQLELFFEPEKFQHLEPVDQKPRLWDRYEHGEASPRPERVEIVALKYPETAIWFHHPIGIFSILIHVLLLRPIELYLA
jgi:hypothetical protein